MVEEGSCGGEPYALRVVGDSMSPEFMDGCIIIVDPSGVINNESYVVAQHRDEYVFRQLIIDNGKYYLRALQEGHETLEITGLRDVAGVVVQQAGRRRKDRKNYT